MLSEDQKKYDTVATRFQDHFIARRNVIFEKATRMQEGGESAESFITSLYGLAEHCGCGALHDELIRDRIVVGIRDTTLSEKLQMGLNLQKAVNAVCQSKAVKSQQTTERGVAKSSDDAIDVLKKSRCPQKGWGYKAHKYYSSYSDKPPVKPLSKIYSKPPQNNNCSHCGQSPMHPRQKCPARDAIFHRCSKKGHFKSVCRSKAVDDISDNNFSSTGELSLLDTVSSEVSIVHGGSQPWTVILGLNSSQTEFKIDTGQLYQNMF